MRRKVGYTRKVNNNTPIQSNADALQYYIGVLKGALYSAKEREKAQQIRWSDSNGPVMLMYLLSKLNEYKRWTCGAFAKPAGTSSVRSSLAPFFPAVGWKLISPCPPPHHASLIPQSLCVPLAMSCQLQIIAFPNVCLKYGPLTFSQSVSGAFIVNRHL